MNLIYTYFQRFYQFQCVTVNAADYNITLSHDGPVVLGGTITFKVDIYKENGERPSGTFKYTWRDNALPPHEYNVSFIILRIIKSS